MFSFIFEIFIHQNNVHLLLTFSNVLQYSIVIWPYCYYWSLISNLILHSDTVNFLWLYLYFQVASPLLIYQTKYWRTYTLFTNTPYEYNTVSVHSCVQYIVCNYLCTRTLTSSTILSSRQYFHGCSSSLVSFMWSMLS